MDGERGGRWSGLILLAYRHGRVVAVGVNHLDGQGWGRPLSLKDSTDAPTIKREKMTSMGLSYDGRWRPTDSDRITFYRSIRCGDYQSAELSSSTDSHPTFEDAQHVIAGIVQLYNHPDDDLHAYTQYLDLAEGFLRDQESKRGFTIDYRPFDPLAGLRS